MLALPKGIRYTNVMNTLTRLCMAVTVSSQLVNGGSTEIKVRNLAPDTKMAKFAGTAQSFFESTFQPGVSMEAAMSRAHSSVLPPPLPHRRRRSALYFQMHSQVCHYL